ncbi:Piso0_004394 [Millerozyma farinosa CBS 7064]|uniref:S-formylglutathione hydrolase n=1 Tax=Pichia sorbitophila (strain ATCC MYA-4447 / BCRC 22081 / CBS 7064 / NBRC 10061 / NRRL Y-12695) TaxID=559304 RepID=G8Y8P1_PICSO|nr:Piso0_004394 [Millerozyma farinosa CBS 7064]CCE84836.1 Piso0_004394 [Millerozyma farinosa CBS 7064]
MVLLLESSGSFLVLPIAKIYFFKYKIANLYWSYNREHAHIDYIRIYISILQFFKSPGQIAIIAFTFSQGIGLKEIISKRIIMAFKVSQEIYQFGGRLYKLSHPSEITKTSMDVNVFVPPQGLDAKDKKIPVLLYLSGLTCTPNNATEKSFFQYFASKYGFAVVFPDTSPRGAKIEGEDESWDFGTGAGFYVDSLAEPWSNNYNMYSYVHKELLSKLATQFPALDFEENISITGHSMGGLGALCGFLKNPGKYKSVSAFAPISNPSTCPWGHKAFSNYLGKDESQWLKYDPTHLIKEYKGDQPTILIHQGAADGFYKDKQLQPENLVKAAEEAGYKGGIDLNIVDGYDHSYFFIGTFSEEHAKHHAKYLGLLN